MVVHSMLHVLVPCMQAVGGTCEAGITGAGAPMCMWLFRHVCWVCEPLVHLHCGLHALSALLGGCLFGSTAIVPFLVHVRPF